MTPNARNFLEGALARSPVVARFAPNDAAMLAKAASLKRFARRTTLDVTEGSARNLYLVMQGQAEYTTTSGEGERFTLVAFGPGSWVNWLGVLEPGRIERQLEATAGTVLITFAGELVRAIVERNPTAYVPLYGELAQRFRLLMNWVERSGLTHGTSRVANLLIALAGMSGDGSSPHVVRISQAQLARLSGCSRQTLNVRLRELSEHGVVETGYGAVTILDNQGLRDFCELRVLPSRR